MNYKTINIILIITIAILPLLITAEPPWPFRLPKKLINRIWNRPSKVDQLCEYICENDPEEGKKHCDCEKYVDTEVASGSSSENRMTLANYFKSETSPSMKSQMCEFICSEDPDKASKYCDCSKSSDSSDRSSSSSSPSSSSSNGRFSLANYFKKESNPSTKSQLCEYICSDDPDEAAKYCDCSKFVDESKNFRANHGNPLSVKNLLGVADPHHRDELCTVICAIDPDSDDGACNCPNKSKKSRRFSWRSIRDWFG